MEFLETQLDILRCYYNFLRPHRALKFGPEIHTPIIQAGLETRRHTFRDVFTFLVVLIWMENSTQFRKAQWIDRATLTKITVDDGSTDGAMEAPIEDRNLPVTKFGCIIQSDFSAATTGSFCAGNCPSETSFVLILFRRCG